MLCTLLDALAFTRVNLGQYDVADELYKRVEDIARDSGDRRLLLSTMINRANFVIRDPQRLHESIPQLAELFLSASDEELRGFKTSMSHILSAPGSAQGPMILRAIDAGVFDDLYTNPSALPRVRQLVSLLFQQSAANPEVVQKAAALLFATGATRDAAFSECHPR